MNPQNFQKENTNIKNTFLELKQKDPQKFKNRLKLSWSNWGFGIEPLKVSLERLKKNNIDFIELHGNRYGDDLGYDPKETKKLLKAMDIKVSGICGMFSAESEFSSNSPSVRQRVLDYMRRNIELGSIMGARYFLVVPGAVGRPDPYDDMEFERSVEALSIVAGDLKDAGIRGAVEPIRSDEVSFCHTFSDAKKYIKALGSPGVQHINGDVYHMMHMESHIAKTIADSEGILTNLHMADTNRDALGGGFLDLDTIIMALYIIGYNNDDSAFVTPEPLGPGGDPYRAMYGNPDSENLDSLVKQTAEYFRTRQEEVLAL
jgi:D-psicose/D-tagatose/L-ribulose 3-epimerase